MNAFQKLKQIQLCKYIIKEIQSSSTFSQNLSEDNLKVIANFIIHLFDISNSNFDSFKANLQKNKCNYPLQTIFNLFQIILESKGGTAQPFLDATTNTEKQSFNKIPPVPKNENEDFFDDDLFKEDKEELNSIVIHKD